MSIKSIKIGELRDAFPDVQTFGFKQRPLGNDSPISNMQSSQRIVRDFKPFDSRITPPHCNPHSSTIKLSPISRRVTSPQLQGQAQLSGLMARMEQQKLIWKSQKRHLQQKLSLLNEQIELQRKRMKDKQATLIKQNRQRICLVHQLQRQIQFMGVKLQAKTLQGLDRPQTCHSQHRQNDLLLQQLQQGLRLAEDKILHQQRTIKQLRVSECSFEKLQHRMNQIIEYLSKLKSSFTNQLDHQKTLISQTLNQLEKQHLLKLKQIKQKCFRSIRLDNIGEDGLYLNKIQKVESRCLQRDLISSQARFSIR